MATTYKSSDYIMPSAGTGLILSWQSNTQYKINSKFEFSNTIFKVITAHQSNATTPLNDLVLGYIQPLGSTNINLTKAQRLTWVTPIEGFKVYQSDDVKGMYVYKNSTWIQLDTFMAYTPIITGSITTPTMGTGYSLKGLFSVSDNSLELDFNLYQAVSGALGSGYYKISIPSGYSIDTTTVTAITTPSSAQGNMSGVDALPVGIGYIMSYNTTYSNPVKVVVLDSTHIGLFITRDDSTYGLTLWGSGYAGLNIAKLNVGFTCKLPIL